MDNFYHAVLRWGFGLILAGMVVLVGLIPLGAKLIKNSPAKTEFQSVRAAYFCVIAGVLVSVLALIGAMVEHIMINMR